MTAFLELPHGRGDGLIRPSLRRRLRLRTVATLVLVATLGVAASTPGNAATSGTVVSASVPSATNVTAAACPAGLADVTNLGIVTPSTSHATGTDCTITWGSSNDTAMLRILQTDGGGQAMQAAPLSGVVGEWSLNNSVADLSGTGNPVVLGAAALAPTYGPGSTARGASLLFDGADDTAMIATNPAYDLGAFTVEAWFRTAGVPAVCCSPIVTRRTIGAPTPSQFNIRLFNSPPEIEAKVSSDNDANVYWLQQPAGPNYADNAWHHVALTYGGSVASMYVDGVRLDSKSVIGTIDTPNQPINVGHHDGKTFPGEIDEVRIQSVARTQAEIRSYYAGQVADHAAGANWTLGANMFGACLAGVAGTGVTPTWTAGGTCPASNGLFWNPVPATAVKVADSGTANTSNATAGFRWGFRPAASQAPGTYRAAITFEVLAPTAP